MIQTLTARDLAAVLQITLTTLQNRLSTRPETLPPKMKIPGQKQPLWMEDDVEKWMRSFN